MLMRSFDNSHEVPQDLESWDVCPSACTLLKV